MIEQKQTILATILLCALAIGGYTFFGHHKNGEEQKLYETTKPIKQPITQYIQASGTLEAEETIIVGSLIAGQVLKIHADENDTIKKGEPLVLLDDGIDTDNIVKAKAVLAQREAECAFETKQFERKKALFEQKHISTEAFDAATKTYLVTKAQHEQAIADLKAAEHGYNNRTITAPTDGIVIARNIELGQMVTSALDATKLFVIAQDLKKMIASIDIDEADIGKVQNNAPVSFYVDAFPTQEYKSTIDRINYQSHVINSVVSYTAEFKANNEDLLLRPGMTVNVDIEVAKNENELTLPLKALRISQKAAEGLAEKLSYKVVKLPYKETRVHRYSVWVLHEDRLEQKEVTLGAQNRNAVAILQGISEQDNVITAIFESTENPLITNITRGKIGG